MASSSETTTDHGTIWRWVEERSGVPATVRSTEAGGEAGVLRIRFSDESGDDLEQIDWDEFFAKFEESRLAFLHQDKASDGGTSRFHKFVRRD